MRRFYLLHTAAVIDDNRDLAEIFAEYLQLLDIKVVSLGYNGKDAVDAYKKHAPDIMFLDLAMPEYDGLYALQEIRNMDPHAKVVIVTGDLNKDYEKRLGALGPSGILHKPFDMDTIKAVIDTAMFRSGFLVGNAKKALVSFTVSEVLSAMGPSTMSEVGGRLYAKYHCYFSDCLEHPEYLRDVLQEIFGNASSSVIESIREKLAAFEGQQISRFLTVLSG